MRYKKLNKRIQYLIIFLLGFIFSAGGIYSVFSNYYEIYKLKKHRKKLLEENKELKNKINNGGTKEFVEYNARVVLGLKKENEIEYRFPPPQEDE